VWWRLVTEADRRQRSLVDTPRIDSLLLLFNSHHEALEWTLPRQWGEWWSVILVDTAAPERRGSRPETIGRCR